MDRKIDKIDVIRYGFYNHLKDNTKRTMVVEQPKPNGVFKKILDDCLENLRSKK